MNKDCLRCQIISETNIYNAIYALSSYMFEKGLLTKDDIALYHRLLDKFDFEEIGRVVKICQDRINTLLDSDELFNVQIFFKLKKYNEDTEKYEFRPIHSASLIDQICMVSMLMPLMFNDTSGVRRLSEISKLIPHNFFGNLPSVSVDEIFEKWQRKYKCYSDEIVRKSRIFKETKQYQYEVCLDLVDFFPSIDPAFIFYEIKKKMALVIDKSDYETLEKVLTKLLYFHIDKGNLKGWENDYYKQDIEPNKYEQLMNKGIAQGLPQAYFFGNLMMMEISEIANGMFKGESYYYVDDSVIFTNDVGDENDFKTKINNLNKELLKLSQKYERKDALCWLNDAEKQIQSKLTYGPRYHGAGKSFYMDIDVSYSGSGGLQYITRQVSLAAVFSNNADEIDDQMSKGKLHAILEVIDNELEKEKKKVDNGGDESKLKLIKRHRRYFLYRYRLLCVREEGDISPKYLDDFFERFQIKKDRVNGKQLTTVLDEEIFQTESRMIVNMSDDKLSDEIVNTVAEFEARLATLAERELAFMYYKRDLSGACLFKNIKNSESNIYKSLIQWCRKNYGNYKTITAENQLKVIDSFLTDWKTRWLKEEPFFPMYTQFVMLNSDEFIRRVMNTFFSTIYFVDVSDEHHFSKNNNRSINYKELRILVYLRNHRFKTTDFGRFVNDVLSSNSHLEKINIDMALMDVIHILVTTIKNPRYVDNLIQTHRLVNGLWKNGSKFLNAYTLHNEEHAITLIKQCVKLLKVIDYISIKQDDYYILFLACYLHDISMVIHPDIREFNHGGIDSEMIVSRMMASFLLLHKKNHKAYHEKFRNLLIEAFSTVYDYFENKKRNNHPKESAEYIKQQYNGFLFYIEKSILELVAHISESHGYDALEVYGLKSNAKDGLYSEKYMMILIRLADLMDMASDRVNYYRLRQNLESLSEVSRFHWISHLITDKAYITAQYEVDKSKRMYEQPITETIQIVIKLNVDYSAIIQTKAACKGCQATHNAFTPSEELIDYHQSVVEIRDKEHVCSCYSSGSCPIICAWMANKNNYLRNELVELKRYLNQANSKLFNTNIEIVLQYQDTGNPLDSDMFDAVYNYLERHSGWS